MKKKVAIIENHESGIYSIRHDLVKAIAEKYDVTILTEVDDSFKNGDLENLVHFRDVGKAVLNPAKNKNRIISVLQHLKFQRFRGYNFIYAKINPHYHCTYFT
jgi:hypothetical protein